MRDPTTQFHSQTPGQAARRRLKSVAGEPLFLAAWEEVVFLHFEVDAPALQNNVPFPLDLYEGHRTFVTLVAFTMRDMRFRCRYGVARLLIRPIATHPFLNLRTCVRVGDEPGIYFLREWMPNRLARLLGPPIFGLPYRLGRIRYRNDPSRGRLHGQVSVGKRRLIYDGALPGHAPLTHCEPGGVEAFLIERYTAYVRHQWFHGLFRVWHRPWKIAPYQPTHLETSLFSELPGSESWQPAFHSAHYSPGFPMVRMGRPQLLKPGNIS